MTKCMKNIVIHRVFFTYFLGVWDTYFWQCIKSSCNTTNLLYNQLIWNAKRIMKQCLIKTVVYGFCFTSGILLTLLYMHWEKFFHFEHKLVRSYFHSCRVDRYKGISHKLWLRNPDSSFCNKFLFPKNTCTTDIRQRILIRVLKINDRNFNPFCKTL